MTRLRQTGIRRSGFLLAAFILMVAAMSIVVLSTDASPFRLGTHRLGGAFELAAAGLGAVVAGTIYWWARRRGRFDPFEMPVWFSLNAYGQVVFNVWILQREQGFSRFVSNMATPSTPALAVLLMAVGLSALWAGYVATTRLLRSRPRPTPNLPGKPRWRLIVGIWAVCKLLEVMSVVSGANAYLPLRSSVWTNYVAFAGHLGDLTAFLLLLYHFRHPRTISWLWLVGMAATNILLGLVVGTKTAVYVLIYAVMAIFYARNRLSVRWLATGFLALLMIVPTVNTFRTNLYRAGFSRSLGAGFAERVPILFSTLGDTLSNPLSGLADETRDTFERRQGILLEVTVAMMAVHPRLQPFVGLDMFTAFAEQAVPRFLWPGKPAGMLDLYLILPTYLGLPNHSLATPGQFGDAYRAGGWLFVVAWFSLLGALSAWLYARGPGSGDLGGTAFYLLMLTSFITYEDHLVSTSMEILKFGIPLWLANRYLLFGVGDRDRGLGSERAVSKGVSFQGAWRPKAQLEVDPKASASPEPRPRP